MLPFTLNLSGEDWDIKGHRGISHALPLFAEKERGNTNGKEEWWRMPKNYLN